MSKYMFANNQEAKKAGGKKLTNPEYVPCTRTWDRWKVNVAAYLQFKLQAEIVKSVIIEDGKVSDDLMQVDQDYEKKCLDLVYEDYLALPDEQFKEHDLHKDRHDFMILVGQENIDLYAIWPELKLNATLF